MDFEKEQNEKDLKTYFELKLEKYIDKKETKSIAVNILTKPSKGLFLYARFVDETLENLAATSENWKVTLDDIKDEGNFAASLEDTYVNFFGRFKDSFGDEDDLYRGLLGPMVVARENVPVDIIQTVFAKKASHVMDKMR